MSFCWGFEMYFFTADEHYSHPRIIEYCNRPFSSVIEMDEEIIKRHNEVVKDNDIVIHGGDFTLRSSYVEAIEYRNQLKGDHIFIRGSHDKWLNNTKCHDIWQKMIEDQYVVVCHYAMRVWPRSHYNSWQLYGHSHGKLEPVGKQWDSGVDNNQFYPVSFDQVKEIMKDRPDNFNLVKKRNIYE